MEFLDRMNLCSFTYSNLYHSEVEVLIAELAQFLFLTTVFWIELLIGTRESKDSRVQAGLAGPSPLHIGLASPLVPASPGEAGPRVQKIGLLPALILKRVEGPLDYSKNSSIELLFMRPVRLCQKECQALPFRGRLGQHRWSCWERFTIIHLCTGIGSLCLATCHAMNDEWAGPVSDKDIQSKRPWIHDGRGENIDWYCSGNEKANFLSYSPPKWPVLETNLLTM